MAGFNPFGSVPVSKKRRTNFDESYELAGTFPLSKVCPVCFIDSLPGSSWNINVFNLTKLETLIAPAMQRVNASILWFKLPKRLVFKNFKKWYSGGEDGEDDHQKPHIYLFKFADAIKDEISAPTVLEQLTEKLFGPGTLWNYLGLPVPLYYVSQSGVWTINSMISWDPNRGENEDGDFVDLLPLMAYNYIYDCYFRDQTLNDPVFVDAEEGDFTINKGVVLILNNNKYYFGPQDAEPAGMTKSFYTSGNNLAEGGEIGVADFVCLTQLFNRAWKKDYFTSALPTPQRGPEVKINLVGEAPVIIPEQEASLSSLGEAPIDGIIAGFNGEMTDGSSLETSISTGTKSFLRESADEKRLISLEGKSSELTGTADMTGLSPISIVALRNLFKLQSFMEKNNVAGGRYIETILAHWGERVPDFTVQRPQFVRATSLPVQISEVTATANSSGTSSIVGDQAGRARTQGNLGSVHIYTQEPSFIFGLYVVTAPPSYAGQGIPRVFQHMSRFDEPWTDFQHIGEQAIKTRELFFPFGHAEELQTDFGYQQRYSEYKFMPDRVVGDFQTSLAFWHMSRMFSRQPYLNGDFVTQNLDPRIFAVQSERPVTASFYFEAQAKLKLSKYSTPKLS